MARPDDIQQKIDKLERTLPEIMSKALGRGLSRTMSEVRQDNISGQVLHVRSGNLRRSGFVRTEVDGTKVRGHIGFAAIYAGMQERGKKDLRPVNAQWLTIPLEAAKTAAGVARGGARSFSNTFFFRSKKGNLILAQKRGKNDFVPLFVLKKSVDIPARPYLRPVLERDKAEIIGQVGKAVIEEIRNA